MTTEEKNLPVVRDISNYAIVSESGMMQEVIEENLKGMDFTLYSLDVIKVPGGGGTVFSVPDFEAESGERNAEFIEGVILHIMETRGYWPKEEGEDDSLGSPPACMSFDTVTGFGEPGGSCANCRFAEFGSGKNNSQACKHNRLIFLATENSVLPTIIKVPPTSLKASKDYMLNLVKRNVKRTGIITRISLKKVPAAGGNPAYSTLVFRAMEKVNNESLGAIARATENTKSFINHIIETTKEKLRVADKMSDLGYDVSQSEEEAVAAGASSGFSEGFSGNPEEASYFK